ncbi:betaine--homocysteine S-methyltransferase 1-like, partial [Elysia marginata]
MRILYIRLRTGFGLETLKRILSLYITYTRLHRNAPCERKKKDHRTVAGPEFCARDTRHVNRAYVMVSERSFQNRLENGKSLVVAEGYLFEFERRGYLKAGAFVPEVVLEHPELVKQLHEEFVHAGSDVVLAFT